MAIDGPTPEAEQASRDAIHAARDAAQAIEMARAEQMKAFQVATTEALSDALRKVFGENTETGRFIDTNKIPFICQDIAQINKTLEKMEMNLVTKVEFWPVKALVYGFVSLGLTAIVGALLILVIKT